MISDQAHDKDGTCLLCGSPLGEVVFPYGVVWDGAEYSNRRCTACRSSIISPLPDDATLARMYDQAAYHDVFYDADAEEPEPSQLASVAHLLKPGGTLLDFGCGNGHFLRSARAAGFAPHGAELAESARAAARTASGCPVSSMEELVEAGARFDVIRLGDVLEHLPDPAATLRMLAGLLAPDGMFLIEGPLEDNASLVYLAARGFGGAKRLLGRPVRATAPPLHLLRTNARAQRAFFEEALGWQVRHFALRESGWPYLSSADRHQRLTPGRAVRRTIGLLAVSAGRVAIPLGIPVGNRFAAVVRPA